MLIMKCNKCEWEGTPNLVETGPHTKALCRGCGKYIKMVNKEELNKLISNEVPPMDEAFSVRLVDYPCVCSACFNENPNKWPKRPNVVLIRTSSTSLYLCEHHRKVLIDILKQY
jgi:hypothetical protein